MNQNIQNMNQNIQNMDKNLTDKITILNDIIDTLLNKDKNEQSIKERILEQNSIPTHNPEANNSENSNKTDIKKNIKSEQIESVKEKKEKQIENKIITKIKINQKEEERIKSSNESKTIMIKNSKKLDQNAYKNFQKGKQNYKNEFLRKGVITERAKNPIINKKVPIKEKITGNEANKIFKDALLKKEDLKEVLPIEESLKN